MWFHQFLHPGAEQDWLDWQGGERSLWLALNSWLQWCLKSTIFSCNIEILINKEFSIFWKHVLALRHFLPIPFPFYQGLILWLSKWKCLWKKSVLYSFHYSEKYDLFPPPLTIVFISFGFFSRKNRSSALLLSPNILNYTFPLISTVWCSKPHPTRRFPIQSNPLTTYGAISV